MRGSGGAHNHTHLISERTAEKTSCAFAACEIARDLLNVVRLFCVAVGCAVLLFADSLMVCILHAVVFPTLLFDVLVRTRILPLGLRFLAAWPCSVLNCSVVCVV